VAIVHGALAQHRVVLAPKPALAHALLLPMVAVIARHWVHPLNHALAPHVLNHVLPAHSLSPALTFLAPLPAHHVPLALTSLPMVLLHVSTARPSPRAARAPLMSLTAFVNRAIRDQLVVHVHKISMVDGVQHHHALLHVVVAIKPALVHVPHLQDQAPLARAHPLSLAILKHALNHVHLVHTLALAHTPLV